MAAPEPEGMALDFSLSDLDGNTICLSDYRSKKHVVLVFNRGLT
jgi:peroxiredoxin